MPKWYISGRPALGLSTSRNWLEPCLQFLSQMWTFITVKLAVEKGPLLSVKCFNYLFCTCWRGMTSCLGAVETDKPTATDSGQIWEQQQFIYHVYLQPRREGHRTPCKHQAVSVRHGGNSQRKKEGAAGSGKRNLEGEQSLPPVCYRNSHSMFFLLLTGSGSVWHTFYELFYLNYPQNCEVVNTTVRKQETQILLQYVLGEMH